MTGPRPILGALALLAGLSTLLSAQVADSSLLTTERLFATDEFQPEYLGGVRWLQGVAAYTKLEPDTAIEGAAGAGAL